MATTRQSGGTEFGRRSFHGEREDGAARKLALHSVMPDGMRPDMDFKAMSGKWFAGTVEGQLGAARTAHEVALVGDIINVKRALFDTGRRLQAASGLANDQAMLDRWLSDEGGSALVAELMAGVWEDALKLDNVVLAWAACSAAPRRLKPEACVYRRAGDRERLDWRHGFTSEDIKLLAEGFQDADEKKAFTQRYAKGEVRVADPDWNRDHPELAEEFRVWRRDASGKGFGSPRLHGLGPTLDTLRSLDIGESLYAYMGRTVTEHHTLGYESKTSGLGPTATHLDDETAKSIKKELEGKAGQRVMVTNFDHKIDYVTIDPEFFAEAKYAGALKRVADWGGPLARIFLSGGKDGKVLPMMGELLLAEARWDREQMALLLEPVLSRFAGVDVRLRWSEECFQDFRQRMDNVFKAAQSGALSNRTLHEAMGVDTDRELERKKAEAKDRQLWMPLYDAHHGDPGAGGGKNGRPPGTPDP